MRSGISGRRGYGSGYPLAAGVGAGALGYAYVGGLGFPYGYWPLYMHGGYYGNDEYGRYGNRERPGGVLVSASFSPSALTSADPPQYMIYGDADSVGNITEALTTDCSATIVVGSTPLNDDGGYSSDVNTTLLPPITPSNVRTYYRSSSFALYSFFEGQPEDPESLVNYTAPAVNSPIYYYPQAQLNQTFMDCANSTIQTWLPIQEAATSSNTVTSAATKTVSTSLSLVGMMSMLLLSGGARSKQLLIVCLFVFLSLTLL